MLLIRYTLYSAPSSSSSLLLLRSSRLEVSYKKGVHRKFAKFTGKHLCQSLFFLLKLQGFRLAALLKKRPWHRCFSVNFAKFLRTPFAIDYLWWLLWLLLISPIFVSGSISKGFKEFKSGISFSLKSLPSVSFSFFHVFSVFLSFVCFSYSCCS